jgi:predicted RNA-binding protein YlxR (DUF448 family)
MNKASSLKQQKAPPADHNRMVERDVAKHAPRKVEKLREQINEGYQADDIRIVNYNLTPLDGTRLKIRRGIDAAKPYGVAIGGAQTFGRYVTQPFAEILARQNGIQVLNLGFSGAGPSFFLRRPELLRWVNKAEFVIVQAMSGRNLSNFAFAACDNQDLVRKHGTTESIPVERAYRAFLLESEPSIAIALRAANRMQWLREMAELFRRITVQRKCLLWFSKRKQNYKEGLDSLSRYWAETPHFLTRPLVEELTKTAGVECVEVVSMQGLPQLLTDMDSKKPVEIWPVKTFPKVKLRCHNLNYPSPEMHDKCANILTEWLKSDSSIAKKLPWASKARRRIIVHHHIFKNAGSSIDKALVDVLGKRWRAFDPQIHVSDDDGRIDGKRCKENINQDELERFLEVNPDVDAVSTHQGRGTFKLSADFEKLELSLIRNPVGRALSIWKYERRPDRQATFDSQMARQAALLPFEKFIEWCLLVRRPPLAPFCNFQVRALSANPTWDARVNYADLDRAIEYVTRTGCVGIVERFERTLELFNQRLEAFIPGVELRSYHVNASGSTRESGDEEARQLLTKNTYELLLEANALDMALYNHVMHLGGY